MKSLVGKIFAAFLLAALFASCSSKSDKPETIDPAFGGYISSYTAGVVPSSSPIRIMLVNNVADSSMVGQEVSSGLFKFSPSLKGKAYWLDPKTIEFKPEERMASGQRYEVRFLLSKLMTVAEKLSEFIYSFRVVAQNFDLSVDNVKPYQKTELGRLRLDGSLTTADFAEATEVEKVLAASQEGRALKINWVHNGDGTQHTFTVEEISRKENASSVKIVVDGTSIKVDRQSESVVEIPSLRDFKLMSTKVVQNPSQYVVLQFSDPIKEKQELAGLITIGDDTNMTLVFDVHDNEIWVYPPVRQGGTKVINISTGVRNIKGYRMLKAASAEITFEQMKPQVRFTTTGNILPSTDGLVMPFEAVNLKSVDVSITQVFENNILQFLQINDLSGNQEMRRVGRPLLKKTISLENNGVMDFGKWNRFTLDLGSLIKTATGDIYRVKLSFKKEYSVYSCEQAEDNQVDVNAEQVWYGDEGEYYYDGNGYDYEEDGYYYVPGYRWEERENPCHVSYYTSDKNISQNILASDLGMIAKAGTDGEVHVFINDLKTTKPIEGVDLEFYDYEQQLLGAAKTSNDGRGTFKGRDKPFAVIAKRGAERSYMKLGDGESLSLSTFDVSGEYLSKGLKGFVYGDRGVWRPGDSLYISFILEDKSKTLPAAHPVVFELQNPQGVVTHRLVKSTSENGFYNFATATSTDAPTGNWQAKIKVGGTDFNHPIKIETVKPNRLKINLDLGGEKITSANVAANLSVNWLHGAPGRNLMAEFEYSLIPKLTTFKDFPEYSFEENVNQYRIETKQAFQGNTDQEGKANFALNLERQDQKEPGFMQVVFRGKVSEESGNFSVDRFSIPYFPFSTYVGYKFRNLDPYWGMLFTDSTQNVDIVTVDVDGKPANRSKVEVALYQLNRYWWWDNYYSNRAEYIARNANSLLRRDTIQTRGGKATWKFSVDNKSWGTYYIRITDTESGHITGSTFYMDAPGYYGRYSRENKTAPTKLIFNTDKKTYATGESVKLNIPGSEGGRALVSIENGRKVLSAVWVEMVKGENVYQFEATPEMSPNVFVHISMLQPHAQTENDLPIRLYGVVPIGVENPLSHLEPVIKMPDVLEPGGNVKITVSEKSDRKMTFTLAVVDEGLLDLTNFETPDPWNRFYAREGLGVKTWDLYDRVMGAFGSKIERILALGGGDEAEKKESDPRANRFKPVVKFFGPITIDAGDEKTLSFTMPQYVGSVKTMLVAGYNGAYGKAEKVTPVKKPLMALATLPRVVGPGEKVKLPITLFASDKKIKNVKVEIKTEGPLVVAAPVQTFTMSALGDLTVDFDVDVKAEAGIGKVKVIATAAGFTGTDEIEIDVRNPNPPISEVRDQFVDAGMTWETDVVPIGMNGTNSASFEVSTLPPLNLGYRLQYLIRYPHGCLEQTTSAAFPQLYLDAIRDLTQQERAAIKYHVTEAINKIITYTTRDGGFGYWPGDQYSDPWGSTYAGQFLIEAAAKGYYIPGDMLNRWKKSQKKLANEWRNNNDTYHYWDYVQAYRLYNLAMVGSPELPAMNRLRETENLSVQSKWMLAAAYAKAGQPEVAKKIITALEMNINPYRDMGYTYGSHIRDKAMIMETLILLGDRTRALNILKDIAVAMGNHSYWMSTQETAYCLKALGNFILNDKKENIKFSYSYLGKDVNASTDLPIAQIDLPINSAKPGKLKFTNKTGGFLNVRVLLTGTPIAGAEKDDAKDLYVATAYTNSKGETIDPTRLEQGTEFLAKVTVKHLGYRTAYQNMALTQIFPSGWEINNARLTGDESLENFDRGDYQDIRDDRVYTYFNLYSSEQRVFTVRLTASYAGTFYLPAVNCEAMYDNTVYGRTRGQKVEVVKAERGE
jgi:alpha-2-macroglobulin